MMRHARRRHLSALLSGATATLATLAALAAPAMAAEGGPAPTGAAALTQVGVGLFAVVALILGLAWVARRAGLIRPSQGGTMKVVGSTMLGARQRLVLVEIEDTWLVLGVSTGEIRTLHTMPARQGGTDASGHTPSEPQGGSFAQKLLRSMQDTRKS